MTDKLVPNTSDINTAKTNNVNEYNTSKAIFIIILLLLVVIIIIMVYNYLVINRSILKTIEYRSTASNPMLIQKQIIQAQIKPNYPVQNLCNIQTPIPKQLVKVQAHVQAKIEPNVIIPIQNLPKQLVKAQDQTQDQTQDQAKIEPNILVPIQNVGNIQPTNQTSIKSNIKKEYNKSDARELGIIKLIIYHMKGCGHCMDIMDIKQSDNKTKYEQLTDIFNTDDTVHVMDFLYRRDKEADKYHGFPVILLVTMDGDEEYQGPREVANIVEAVNNKKKHA